MSGTQLSTGVSSPQTSMLTITPEFRNLDHFPLELQWALIYPTLPVCFWRGGLELRLDIIPVIIICSRECGQRVGAVWHEWTIVYDFTAEI